MKAYARLTAVLLALLTLLSIPACADEEPPRFLQAAQEGLFARQMTFLQVCDFVQLARPEHNIVKSKESDGFLAKFYAEDYVAMIVGSDGLYDYFTVLNSLRETPEVFGEEFFSPDDVLHFLICDAGVTSPVDATVSTDDSLLIVTIGERRYELPISHRTDVPWVYDVEAYTILWDIYPAESYLPAAGEERPVK